MRCLIYEFMEALGSVVVVVVDDNFQLIFGFISKVPSMGRVLYQPECREATTLVDDV